MLPVAPYPLMFRLLHRKPKAPDQITATFAFTNPAAHSRSDLNLNGNGPDITRADSELNWLAVNVIARSDAKSEWIYKQRAPKLSTSAV